MWALLGIYLGITSRLEMYENLNTYQKKEILIICTVNMLSRKYFSNNFVLYNNFINENFDKSYYEDLGIKLDEILYIDDENFFETFYSEFINGQFLEELDYEDRLRLTEYIFKIYEIDRGFSLEIHDLKYLILKLKCKKSDIIILSNKYKVG